MTKTEMANCMVKTRNKKDPLLEIMAKSGCKVRENKVSTKSNINLHKTVLKVKIRNSYRVVL